MDRPQAEIGMLVTEMGNIRFQAAVAAEVLAWPHEQQERLRSELQRLFHSAFPRMTDTELLDWVEDYFRLPAKGFQRHAFLLWKESGQLCAASLFDEGGFSYRDRLYGGLYIIGRAVSPEHQGGGFGQRISTVVLAQFKPDVLMTTCTQAASLHSWIAVARRRFSAAYDAFPRMERGSPRTFPLQNLGFIVSAFREMYSSVVHGDRDLVDKAVAGLSVLLIRNSMYDKRYDFSPWEKAGRSDPLATALGVRSGDGILVVIVRKGLAVS